MWVALSGVARSRGGVDGPRSKDGVSVKKRKKESQIPFRNQANPQQKNRVTADPPQSKAAVQQTSTPWLSYLIQAEFQASNQTLAQGGSGVKSCNMR